MNTGKAASGADRDETQPASLHTLQFGEGNFLRPFVDWMIQKANDAGVVDADVRIVQPLAEGTCAELPNQDNRYSMRISTRSSILPSTLQSSSSSPIQPRPASSFPGKLLQWLHRRFTFFGGDPSKGPVFLPCELIEDNGTVLRNCLHRLAERWNLEDDFTRWLDASCRFCNTLVDRIVPGFPVDEYDDLERLLGGPDRLLVTGELFHLWVIETPADIAGTLPARLPLGKAGLNVLFTRDLRPFRERKVRILNGAHTVAATLGLLCGLTTVDQCLDDPVVGRFPERVLRDEFLPSMDGDRREHSAYADTVAERFRNPFLAHRLASICLNSASKFVTRLLPSLRDYVSRKGKLPPLLTFSLAVLLVFYRHTGSAEASPVPARAAGAESHPAYTATDSDRFLAGFRAFWSGADTGGIPSADAVRSLLGDDRLWGADLDGCPGLTRELTARLRLLHGRGPRGAVRAVLG